MDSLFGFGQGADAQTMKSSTRILIPLPVVCSLTLPTSLILGGYFFRQNREITKLKSTLLSQKELQETLVNAHPLARSIVPHIVREIGFVLNPHMKRSTLAGYPGEPYPINSLGLRGPEISPKEPDATRVVLVGDSVLFGWRLRDRARLSSILNNYVNAAGERKKVEFVTVALPSWNIRSEKAFLEAHLHLLDPDAILWWMMPNDIEDVPGAVPPGYYAGWASPQAEHDSPFTGLTALQRIGGSFMPAIADRRQANVELVASFESEYDIPIVVVVKDIPSLREFIQAAAFDDRRIFVPELFASDPRWPVGPGDMHPSAWANRIMAIGIASKLDRLGIIPEMTFNENEQAVVRVFERLEAEVAMTTEAVDDYSSALSQIPTAYVHEDPDSREAVLYGLDPGGTMARAGTLFLRDRSNSSRIAMRIKSLPNIDKYPGTVRFSVRNREGGMKETTVRIASAMVDVLLEVPKGSFDPPVYEVSWYFDFSLCSGPDACSSGQLLYARFD